MNKEKCSSFVSKFSDSLSIIMVIYTIEQQDILAKLELADKKLI